MKTLKFDKSFFLSFHIFNNKNLLSTRWQKTIFPSNGVHLRQKKVLRLSFAYKFFSADDAAPVNFNYTL